MKKNKKNHRIFSRVLSYLAWATARRVRGEHGIEYREVTAAKRLIVEFGGEDVKPVFYDREWHIEFTVYRYSDRRNRYYTVSASHGYVNDYHRTNQEHIEALIDRAAYTLDYTLRRDYQDYQMFRQYGDNVLYWILTGDEYDDYTLNGDINAIPYDVSIRLWRDLRGCAGSVVNEAIAHKKVVI